MIIALCVIVIVLTVIIGVIAGLIFYYKPLWDMIGMLCMYVKDDGTEIFIAKDQELIEITKETFYGGNEK